MKLEAILQDLKRLYAQDRKKWLQADEDRLGNEGMERRMFWENVDAALEQSAKEHVKGYVTQAQQIQQLHENNKSLSERLDHYKQHMMRLEEKVREIEKLALRRPPSAEEVGAYLRRLIGSAAGLYEYDDV